MVSLNRNSRKRNYKNLGKNKGRYSICKSEDEEFRGI